MLDQSIPKIVLHSMDQRPLSLNERGGINGTEKSDTDDELIRRSQVDNELASAQLDMLRGEQ